MRVRAKINEVRYGMLDGEPVAYVRLDNKHEMIVDEEDYWKVKYVPIYYGKNGYASGRIINEKKIDVHRVIMQPADGEEIDHVNRNKLDNRKSNLRSVPHQMNSCNRPFDGYGKSRKRGVRKYGDKWVGIATFKGKEYRLGIFQTIEDAEMSVRAFWKERGVA